MADKNTTSNINLAAAEELPKAQSKFKEFVKKFMKRKTAVISLAFIVFIILMAIIGPYVVPYDPQAPDYTAMMQGPSAAHIWGTNEYGQDVFSRLMVGTRLSLTCALTATIIGTAIGVVLGLIAGFYGGIIDSLIMRCCDVLFAFPDILLAIAVVAIIGQGMVNVMIAVAVFTVPSFARIIRSATISVKQAPYVEVARVVFVRLKSYREFFFRSRQRNVENSFFFRLVAARNRAVRRKFVFSYAGQNHLFKFATFRLMYCDKRYLFKLFAYHVHLASR